MAAFKKPGDALNPKQRKQKVFCALGAAALLAAGVYEYPMISQLMGGGGETAPPPPAQTTAAAPGGATSSLVPPTPAAAGGTPLAAVGQLVDSDVPPPQTQSVLV